MLKRWGRVILAMLLVCFLLTTCTCEHKWKEATCTEPKTCVYCGMTEGEPLGHDWKAARSTTPRPVFAAVKQKVKLTVSIKKPMQNFDCIGFLLVLIYRSILELRFVMASHRPFKYAAPRARS